MTFSHVSYQNISLVPEKIQVISRCSVFRSLQACNIDEFSGKTLLGLSHPFLAGNQIGLGNKGCLKNGFRRRRTCFRKLFFFQTFCYLLLCIVVIWLHNLKGNLHFAVKRLILCWICKPCCLTALSLWVWVHKLEYIQAWQDKKPLIQYIVYCSVCLVLGNKEWHYSLLFR